MPHRRTALAIPWLAAAIAADTSASDRVAAADLTPQAPIVAAEVVDDASLKPGDVFRDCPHCPKLVVLPAGSFMMGSRLGERDRDKNEEPQHRVTIPVPFALGVYEVTFDEWDACLAAGGCGGYRPDDAGWGRGTRPVINVSWNDTQLYIAWLHRQTGRNYRLPSEAEWEYAARAGTTTAYSWGRYLGNGNANCSGCGSPWDDTETASVGSFRANPFGLWDMHGNALEWTQDCRHPDYVGAPNDGSSWERDCLGTTRIVRGGSWGAYPNQLRAAARDDKGINWRMVNFGFRVARALTP
jgi:formylglycine-generating enzyme required for sulfatase activity